MKQKYVHIYTIGCQMNVYDSDLMAAGLAGLNYQTTDTVEQADLVIINTCSVREKAEQKVFSYLGRMAQLKRRKPGLIIGVGGCVAQQEGDRIVKRAPYVDLVFGTRAVDRLPRLVERIEQTGRRVVELDMAGTGQPGTAISSAAGLHQVSGFVTIMRGCDNYCTYCVVPYVRGREISRSPEDILAEIRTRVASGTREVTLLGQNVNSYGTKEGLCSFPELLARVNDIGDLWRVRFTTSHPKDLSDELIAAFGQLDKLCWHIHLPVQSGSDRMLDKMNRRYTRAAYLEKVARLRAVAPGIAVTSDIIVGFPGETDADFQQTLDLLAAVEFDNVFAFAYSDRPNAPAARFSGKLPEPERRARLIELLDVQKAITKRKNRALVGSTERILVDGPGRNQAEQGKTGDPGEYQWTGRTAMNKIVHFNDTSGPGEDRFYGRLLDVLIEKAYPNSVHGKPVKVVA